MKLHQGTLLNKLKRSADALKTFNEVLNNSKYAVADRVHAAFQAALVSEQNGDLSTARELYNSAGRRFAGDPEFSNRIRMQLLEFLVRTKEFSPAAMLGEELAGVEGVDTKRLDILRLKALSELKRYADAAVIAKHLSLSTDSFYAVEGAWQLARLTELQGNTAKAKELYLSFAGKFSGDKRVPDAMLAAADIAISSKDLKEAALLLNDYLEKFPKHEGLRKALSVAIMVHLRQDAPGDRDKAELLLQKMNVHFPESSEADLVNIEFIRYLYKTGELASALKRVELFLKERSGSPAFPEALMLGGMVFDKMDNHEKTMEFADRILDKYPSSPFAVEAAMLGGSSCFQKGNYERALKYYERAGELGGRGVVAQVAAGEAADCHLLLRQKENLEAAIRIYTELSRKPDFPALQVQAYFKLGLALEYSSAPIKALKAYEELLALAVRSDRVRRSSGVAPWCARAARSALKIILGTPHLPDGSQRAQKVYHHYSQLDLPDSGGELKKYLEEIRQHYNLLD